MNKNKHPYISKKVLQQRSTLKRNVIIFFMCIGLFFTSMYGFKCFITKVCGSVAIDKFVRSELTVLMPKGALVAEVANTRQSRELGLSGRNKMREDEGMLFVFETPGRYGFWMKDMDFPLDLIWFNQNGIVVSIERNVDKDSYPKTFINQADASYVLEMSAGQAEKFGLYLGSKIKLTD